MFLQRIMRSERLGRGLCASWGGVLHCSTVSLHRLPLTWGQLPCGKIGTLAASSWSWTVVQVAETEPFHLNQPISILSSHFLSLVSCIEMVQPKDRAQKGLLPGCTLFCMSWGISWYGIAVEHSTLLLFMSGYQTLSISHCSSISSIYRQCPSSCHGPAQWGGTASKSPLWKMSIFTFLKLSCSLYDFLPEVPVSWVWIDRDLRAAQPATDGINKREAGT